MSTKGRIFTHSVDKGETKVKVTSDQTPTTNGTIRHSVSTIKDNSDIRKTVKKATLGYISHEETINMVKSESNDLDKTVYKNKEAPYVVHNKLKKADLEKTKKTTKKLYIPFNKNDKASINDELEKNKPIQEKTVEDLDNMFNHDVGLIIEDILKGNTNFEEYPIRYKIRGFDIFDGEEGFAEKTDNHPFTLRAPNPKALSYMASTFLTRTHKMRYDSHKILAMLIDTLRTSPSLQEWLMMLSHLWDELKTQQKI